MMVPLTVSRSPVGSSSSSSAGRFGDGAGDGDALLLSSAQLRGQMV